MMFCKLSSTFIIDVNFSNRITVETLSSVQFLNFMFYFFRSAKGKGKFVGEQR